MARKFWQRKAFDQTESKERATEEGEDIARKFWQSEVVRYIELQEEVTEGGEL